MWLVAPAEHTGSTGWLVAPAEHTGSTGWLVAPAEHTGSTGWLVAPAEHTGSTGWLVAPAEHTGSTGWLVAPAEHTGSTGWLVAPAEHTGSTGWLVAPAEHTGSTGWLVATADGRAVTIGCEIRRSEGWAMARIDLVHPDNVEGPWFVDTRCIRCDAARHWAPGLIEMDDRGSSFVARQPEGSEEAAALWRAAAACPTQSIGSTEERRPPSPAFPFELTPGVCALGHNARESFGAHSYLVPRPDGNLMTDSPRFTRGLAERIDDLGGVRHVLLSHRDDVADADRWADRYGADVWIHEADADAAPYATVILAGDEPAEVAPGAVALPVPGHTEGSIAFHIDDEWLFTGDTLHWNHRRDELDVFPEQTFHSWEVLADSIDRLATLRVEWVFPGHGNWGNTGAAAYAKQMSRLGPAMREIGRAGWARRPKTAYDWY